MLKKPGITFRQEIFGREAPRNVLSIWSNG